MTKHIPDVDFANMDSHIKIRAEATKIEDLGYKRGTDEPKNDGYGDEIVSCHTETIIVIKDTLGNNIVNIEAYFDDSIALDYPGHLEKSGATYQVPYHDAEVLFNLYSSDLREAARVRAAEDETHEVRQLAEWTYLAGDCKRVDRSEAGIFWRALKDAVDEVDNVPDWALCRGGRPELWRHALEPVTTLDEAREYIQGGYDTVWSYRGDDDV